MHFINNKTPSVLYTTSERWSLLAPFPGPGLVKFNKIYAEKVN